MELSFKYKHAYRNLKWIVMEKKNATGQEVSRRALDITPKKRRGKLLNRPFNTYIKKEDGMDMDMKLNIGI